MTKERLQIKAFHIKNVALGRKVKIENNSFSVRIMGEEQRISFD